MAVRPGTVLNSVEQCNAMCAVANYTYFGVQMGHACFCGNAYGSFGAADKGRHCNVTCTGNASEICGGSNVNGVWRVLPPAAVHVHYR